MKRSYIFVFVSAAITTSVISFAQTAQPDFANVKFGPSIGFEGMPSQFSLQFEGAMPVANNWYATVSPTFQFGKFTLIGLPFGAQYEFEIPTRGFTGLYAYPHFSIGYAGAFGGGSDEHGVLFSPEIGFKYKVNDKYHIGVEPLSFPILFMKGGPYAAYRMYFYAGANF